MYAVQNKRWAEAALLNPCQRNLAILSHIIDITTNEIMHKDFQLVSAFSKIKSEKTAWLRLSHFCNICIYAF